VHRKAFHERVLDEILHERLACRRGRRNLRSVKRKKSRQTNAASDHQSGNYDC
jgi:ribose 1,5-bisphosphokinase PhnN